MTQRPHVCPWWLAVAFDNPLRRLAHDPRRILAGLVRPGDTVLDLGCGLGHFSLGMAEMVGPKGCVIAVDLQSEMLRRAKRRAERRGLADRIRYLQATPERIGLTEPADFALAFWMVHEVSERRAFLAELRQWLRPGAPLLIVEPKGHVSPAFFERILQRAAEAGFLVEAGPPVRFSRSALCRRPTD